MKIVKFPESILRESMPEFNFENPLMDPKELEKQMIETMFSNNGIGLAAPQVGIKTRMFVMGSAEFPDNAVGVFNPIVEEATDFEDLEEGCLSFPGVYATIKRPKQIKVRWQNSSGEWQQADIDGMACRCFLHELDHLEGIVFKDRLSQLKWALAVKKSQKRKGKF